MTDQADRITAVVDRLGHLGDGICDGPAFASRCLPGETVSGVLQGDRLTEIRIETPSEERVRPPCKHYASCGGCALQHASDAFVANWKVTVVRAALEAHELPTPIRRLHTSPARTRRRAVFSARRTKKGAIAGFHGRASGALVDVADCHLLHPDLANGPDISRALAIAGASRKAELKVAATVSDAGLDVDVAGGKPLDVTLRQELADTAERFDLARICWDGEVIATRHPPAQRFGTAQVVPPPGSFLQATREGELALLASVAEAVSDSERIADLFAGCGTFALPLANSAEVHAVEGSAAMTAALDAGWRGAKGLRRVTSESRDLFRRPLTPDELAGFDAVVIDPPRAGALAQVREIAEAKVPTIAAVSCNPVTFARDAAALSAAGYRLEWVDVVDQFRWSPHVELAARFSLPTD